MTRFIDQVAVVTGAAGGIGQATVRQLTQEGAKVIAVDIDVDQMERTFVDLPQEVVPVAADVADEADVKAYLDLAMSRFGRLDVLFNNAGIEGVVSPLESYPLEMFEKVLRVNVNGVFLGLKHGGPLIRQCGGGAIVNSASVAGLQGNPMLSAYIASKHAVIGLTRSAAISFGPDGVRVNAICPAPIETRMMRSIEQGAQGKGSDTVKSDYARRIPLRRYGEPEEVAKLVAFLASSDASYINGSQYTIDGGLTPH